MKRLRRRLLPIAIALLAGGRPPVSAEGEAAGRVLRLDAASFSPEGSEHAPRIVPFRDGRALRFERARASRIDLGQGEGGRFRLASAFTLGALIQLEARPEAKTAIISKWRLAAGGRSYELGVTPSSRLFFTVSASGSWPERARELLSTRALKAGVPYAVAAVYEPGRRMALHVNGIASGELTDGVPERAFDSQAPLIIGSRDGLEKECALDGLIARVTIDARALTEDDVRAEAARLGCDQPPELELPALKPPYDLDAVREKVRAWYGALQAPGEPYGAYRLTPRSPPDLYASADIAWIRWMMDDLDLTAEQRAAWIGFIQDQQESGDGGYRHITGHCRTHAFCHATGALNMLGGAQRHRPELLDAYRAVDGIPAWLDSIDWVKQWGGSHDIWGAGVPLVCTPETPQEWRDALFRWLDAEVDPQTGFWRRGVKARSPLEYLGGAFHIWPLYAALDRPLPHPAKVIDGVLALERPGGSFDGAFNYGNMDGVWVLEHLMHKSPHRRADVRAALERNLRGLMALYNDSPERFLSDAHGTESRIATLAILQSALPDQLRSKTPWRNPWHRRELFAIRVE
ncbi:MAG: LamG domain-containing protein [Planctomycetes bacterium]|nr:LamG domain-containing protein [Planctomycetota bacterium]